MYTIEDIKNCRTEKELFSLWKSKDVHDVEYIERDKIIKKKIDHSDVFIEDGVVNWEIWADRSKGKHILYILKEAYGGEKDWSLAEEVRLYAPWSGIWNRIVEWTYGITNTSLEKLSRYVPDNISFDKPNPWLNQIAILNIKKSSGDSKSHYGEISAYADFDAQEIIRQIEIIDPDIVVCGATFGDIDRITGNIIKKCQCDNWYYYSEAIGDKERLFIDYYHPANRYPALLNYYGIISIYQQALLEKR